jgi:PAS domain S-box-containing protein
MLNTQGKILIIDDDPEIRSTLSDVLEEAAYEVSGYEKGGEALDCLRKNAFDVVIVDIKLPDIDGMKLLEEIKLINPDSAVIMVTGHASMVTAIESLNEGAYAYIVKPFNIDELRTVIKKAIKGIKLSLENKKLIDQLQMTNKDLEKYKKSLEERTVELTHANEQLTMEINEREKVEQQVRQQNEFLSTVLESLTHPFYVVNVHDYTIKMANSAAKQLYSDMMYSKMTCHMLSHLRSRACDTVKDPCPIDEIRRTGKPVVVEHVHYDADHNPKNVEVHAYPIFDDRGELSEVIEYSLDITERKKAEIALKESEGKLRSIVENSSDQIFMLDQDYKFLSINKTAAGLLRKSPQEMIGKSIFEIFPENIAEQFSKNIKNVFDTGERMSIEEKMVLHDREFYNSTSLNPVNDNRGAVIAVTGIVRDITKCKQAEQTLRKSENKYRTLIENLPQRIFLKDRDSTYVSCNENYAQDVGVDPDEIKGKTDYEFFPRELAEQYRQDDRRIIETGVTETIEEKYVHAEQEMIIQTVKTPVKDEQGNIIGVLGIFWDITDLKRAQEELRQTNEKLLEASRKAGMAEVAADVLHNVGNVLNSINVSTTVITEKIKESELENLGKVVSILNEHTNDLEMFLAENPQGKKIPIYLTEVSKVLINEQAETLKILRTLSDNVQHVKDIITAQQSYAKVSGVEVTASISRLVEDAIQINSAGLQRHGTRLVREFEELGDVEINKQKVLQILVNLISNAKYALSSSEKEEKIVTIRTYKHREDRFRIEVADNGIGISRENLTRIFSHGFTTKEHGHGFGLHSSALASKEIGGSLTVHSDGLERGATFTLELPFKPAEIIK